MFSVALFQRCLRFPLGELQFSPLAIEAVGGAEVEFARLLYGYQCGRWSDKFSQANDGALRKGNMIMSIFELSTGVKLVVGTKADRSATGIIRLDECGAIEF